MVETIVDDKNPAKLMSALASLAFTRAFRRWPSACPTAKRAALAAAVKKSGFPPAALDRMETWAAAFMLLGAQFKASASRPAKASRRSFAASSRAAASRSASLRRNAEQFGYFDRLPEKAQRSLLEGAIEDGPAVKDSLRRDAQRLGARRRRRHRARRSTSELADSPELDDALITQRNANWAKWVEARMAKPGQSSWSRSAPATSPATAR